jgi:hypothetical protein
VQAESRDGHLYLSTVGVSNMSAVACPSCGCDPGCIIAEDDFARANSTSLGSLWTEDTGDASILDGQLVMPSNGILECTSDGPAPSGVEGHSATWSVFFGSTTSVTRYIRVHVDVVDDDNSFYAEVKPVIGTPTKFRIELFDLSSGSPTSVAGPEETEDINGDVSFEQLVCVSIDGTTLKASINTHLLTASITPHGGTKTRLQSINMVNPRFDNFTFKNVDDEDCQHHCVGETADPGACDDLTFCCQQDSIPTTLFLTVLDEAFPAHCPNEATEEVSELTLQLAIEQCIDRVGGVVYRWTYGSGVLGSPLCDFYNIIYFSCGACDPDNPCAQYSWPGGSASYADGAYLIIGGASTGFSGANCGASSSAICFEVDIISCEPFYAESLDGKFIISE